ncbi:MAG: hypothetical protein J6X02_02665 [Bacilli bacterium]|nr:hypothetical protein [Bacilli bacterium]
MKLSDFTLIIENNNVLVKGPEGFANGIAENQQYLTNYNLAYLLMMIKSKVGTEKWKEIKEQIEEI